MAVPENPRSLGLPYREWRPGQREVIEEILARSKERQVILLEAPYGTGKSAIAVSTIGLGGKRGFILTKTIQLQDQYARLFKGVDTLVGKSRFSCILPGQERVPVSEARCRTGWRCPEKPHCPYFVSERKALGSHILVTNYSKAVNSWLGKRDWLVCDEGHALERELLSAGTIRLPYKLFSIVDMTLPGFGSIQEASQWAVGKEAILAREVAELGKVLREAPEDVTIRQRYFMRREAHSILHKLSIAETDQVWTIEPYRTAMYLRPLWASKESQRLLGLGDHVLIQSATFLDPERITRLLGIDRHDYHYIQMPNPFPKERRPIYYWPIAKMGLNSTEDDHRKILAAIDLLLDHYPRRRGIIHTVNWTLTQMIAERTAHRDRVIVAPSGKKRQQGIDRWLRTPYAVLVSPSVMVGLDGRFERARFQIIVKLPFEDQGERAVLERLEQDELWYAYQCAFNLQQAYGRVVRDHADYGETWILDEHFGWFYRQYPDLFSDWFKEALHHGPSPELTKQP